MLPSYLPMSTNKFSRNSINSGLVSNLDTLTTSINVYNTFKMILKFIESKLLI